MPAVNQPKYDRTTLGLHAALAAGVVTQLLLGCVMHVPPGPGLGIRDWHRQAFEIHARVGVAVAVVCALHWLWIGLPWSRPGVRALFPWIRRESRKILYMDTKNFLRFEIPANSSPLVATVHGLGLVAVTGSAIGGIINYLGYFTGAPVPAFVLHWVARGHIALGYIVGIFLAGHTFMAILHRSKRYSAQAQPEI
ncbi:MAG TPA: cytochrome b/b6 domain-containing protein [Steroidobacteraceae bacterium]